MTALTSVGERADILIVLAKRPEPGQVKTRLQTRFTPGEAAALAAAALADTATAVQASAAPHRLLALAGDPTGLGAGFVVCAQPDGTLNDRLTAAFASAFDAGSGRTAAPGARPERALLVGMDTPQVTPERLDVDWAGADALLGLSEDGGFWAIGLRSDHPDGVFDGVPMSTARTGSAQLARLMELGLSVKLLSPLRDVDLPADARAVADRFPRLQFSRLHAALLAQRPEQSDEQLFDAVFGGDQPVEIQPYLPERAATLVVDRARWNGEADSVDLMVVARCEAPVIDLGCGPGRMVRALTCSGRAALGVDLSAAAVRASLARGGPALHRPINGPLPAEGRWGTALLMDGNLGIGGDVPALLRRCRDLVGTGGLVICEVDPDPDRHEVSQVVLRTASATSEPIPWSSVGASALGTLAAGLGLTLQEEWSSGGRSFVSLRTL